MVVLAVGTAGTAGTAFTNMLAVDADIQVGDAASLVVRVWLPASNPAKVTPAW
jgi:hypothetical protein